MLKQFAWCFLPAALLSLLATPARGQPPEPNLWSGVAQVPPSRGPGQDWVQPQAFRGFTLNHAAMRRNLRRALPEAAQRAAISPTLITLPLPDGTLAQFRFVESPVMVPGLAAQFPEIKTYVGQGVDDPAASARFDITPAGFHAQVLSPQGAVYIDPYFRGDTNLYACYYKRDYHRLTEDFQCFTAGRGAESGASNAPAQLSPPVVSGGNLRTYRLACAATAEYTAFHGGTVSAGMSAIVTAINRVTGVYESEVAIRLMLVTSNNLIVYTNASTEPYTNNNPNLLLSQNQSNLDTVIGSANYDIGHVFSTAGGGLAGVGVVCVDGNKARGETGTSAPIGDAFYIDYVAHEMGHQFGAHHTFNSSTSSCGGGNRTASTAYEPGSGSTIMAYAGICGADNLQPHSDPYFHTASLDEIVAYSTSGAGNSCAVVPATGNNAPAVSAGLSFAIPKGTPFTLTATASDPDSDPLTYCWEERDLGPSIALTAPDNGSSPLFRSFNPSSSPSRTLPRLSNILANTSTPGEMLPATNRTMAFRVAARDNRAGGGGVSTADMQVIVASNVGPFVVTSPASAVTWSNLQTVTWNVAGTAGAPVNSANVNILLSTNGGASFPIVLASNTPNDGSQSVLLPNIATSFARIEVQAAGNIFFAISPSNFTIVPVPTAALIALATTTLLFENCFSTNGVIDPGETVTMNFSLTNSGTANTTNLVVTLLATNGVSSPSDPQSYGIVAAGGAAVARPFTFTASGNCGGSITPILQLQDGNSTLNPLSKGFGLGNQTITTQSFTNSGNISIPDNIAAAPYPSAISVSNLTGTITRVTATLRGLSHTFPDDIDILLVGPGGQKLLLMSDSGGGNGVNGITLTLDDSAAPSLPDSTQITAGTYKPTNFDTNTDVFPASAPAGPYGSAFSIFNGLNPNGAWSLYVRDDDVNDTGSIAQGWSLAITTSNTLCCSGIVPLADLGVTQTVISAALNISSNVTFTTIVTNLGPSAAGGVVVTDALPAALSFTAATASQGSWTNNGGAVTFSLGTITNGGSAILTVSATAVSAGHATNTAAVTTTAIDQVSSNNAASVALSINAFPTISTISPQTTAEDTPTAAIAFVIGDAETAATSLILSGVCSDTNLVTNTNIVFGGSGSNRTVTLTPAPNQPGTATVSIAVSDGLATSSTSFSLTVTPVNDPPVLAALTNYVVNEGDTLTFTATATDVESPPEILTFTLSNAPPAALLNPTNGVFSWTTTEADGPGTNTIIIIVTDNGSPNRSDAKSFTVVVNEVNRPPVLPAQPDRTIAGLAMLTVTNRAADPDFPANALVYAFELAPAGASINTNGLITWTPTASQVPSTNVFRTVVTDSNPAAVNVQHLSATNSFTVVVNAVHNGPTAAMPGNQTVNELSTLIVTNTATDGDVPALQLTYQLVDPPAGAAVDTNGIVTWTPDELQGPATNLITVVATDDGSPPLSATNSFSVVVQEVNSPPILPPQPDRTVIGLASLTVTNTATDPDVPANTLNYIFLSSPTNAVIDANGIITWTPQPAQVPSTNLFTTLVTDFNPDAINEQQLKATNTFTVVVEAIHNGPSLPVQNDTAIDELTTLTVTNTATDNDIPAPALTYELLNAPVGATIDTNGVITWKPDESQGPGTNTITSVVTDNGNPPLSATNWFIVVVTEFNLPPVLATQTDRTIAGLETLIVTNNATDADLPTNLLSYVLLSGPPNAVIDTNGLITWQPQPDQVPSTNLFTTVVTDYNPDAINAQQLSATNQFTVVVTAVHNGPALADQTNRATDELAFLVVTNTATDGDVPVLSLSYQLINSPPGTAIDTNGIITWIPDETQGPSTNIITTVVTDSGDPPLSATNSFVVVVNEVNSPPSLAPIADRTIISGQSLTLTNTAIDPDIPANALTFSLEAQPLNSSTINPTNGVFTWMTASDEPAGTNFISVIVTDDGSPSLSTTQTFKVAVLASLAQRVPQVPDQTIIEEQLLVVTNFSAANNPSNALTYSLATNAPAGAIIDPTNGVFTWAPTEAQGPSTNLITVYTMDPGPPAQMSTQTFTVYVLETNSPPVLAGVADHALHAGSILTISNSATDPDIPANGLTFSLEPGAPPEASINSTNGLLSWPTTDADANTTNQFTVRVTDDGLPPQSDARSFTVTVFSRPAISSITVSNDLVTITWTAIPGQSYRAEYVDDLANSNWIAFTSDVLATESTAVATDSIVPGSQRFYRVLVLP